MANKRYITGRETQAQAEKNWQDYAAKIDAEVAERMRRVISGCCFRYNEKTVIQTIPLPEIDDNYPFQLMVLPGAIDEKYHNENLPIIDLNHESHSVLLFNRPDKLKLSFRPDGLFFMFVPIWNRHGEKIYDELDNRGYLGVSTEIKMLERTVSEGADGVVLTTIKKAVIQSISILTGDKTPAFPSGKCKFNGAVLTFATSQ